MFCFANASPFEQTYRHRATYISFSLLEGLCYYNLFYFVQDKECFWPQTSAFTTTKQRGK